MDNERSTPADGIQLGDFEVRATGETRNLEGETATGARSRGRAVVYRVTGPGGIGLDVSDVRWANGDRDVRVLGRHVSPQVFDRLRQGLRLGVHRHRQLLFVELGQARLKDEDWSNIFQADSQELAEGAGVDVRAVLLDLGAGRVDTREHGLSDRGHRRNWLCAVFGEADHLVPVAAYVLTRIAPLAHGVRA